MIIETSYYEDSTRLNNSGIGDFLTRGPFYFYQKLNKLISEDSSSMRIGRVIHMYILQTKEFWDNYIVNQAEGPKSAYQKDFCDKYINSKLILDDQRALEAYKSVYSTTGQSEEKMLENALKYFDGLKEYIKFIEEKGAKEEISWSEFTRCKTILENIKRNKKANYLLFELDENNNYETHNEFHINWNFINTEFSVECKSLLDRVVFKKDYSEVYLIDLKTTGNVYNFKESFDKYDYGRQMCFYQMAIKWYMKDVLKLDHNIIENVKIITYIIAIGSNNEIKVYEISDDLINQRKKIIEDTITRIVWHTNMCLWEYDKEYYDGDGSTKLE